MLPVISLQSLFQCDQILYTIVPVSGKEQLESAYIENSEGVSTEGVLVIFCSCCITGFQLYGQ